MFAIPILLITFNRPEHTRRVLGEIMKQGPSDVYVFQDGARGGNESDSLRCAQVREVISTLTKGTRTRLHTYFADVNLGCGAGPMTGISWFFSQVAEGIVMEDDCLPHPDFFGYCSELLARYREDKRVMYVSSTLYDDRWKCEASYDFSHYMITGAWASWARAWKGFDLDLDALNARRFRQHCKRLLKARAEADWWYFKTLEIQRDTTKKSYWDYQMQIHLFRHDGITIHPQRNLVSNIGFDAAGTHTLDNNEGRGDKPVYPILPLSHPASMEVDLKRDNYCFAKKRSDGWLHDELQYLYKRMLFNQGLAHRCLMVYKRMKHGR